MNTNKCHGPAPVTTVVYRTIQDVIDHVIFPAIKDAGKDPDHYDLDGFAKDWVVHIDHHALFGYFNMASNIATEIEEYSTATKAQDLRQGDRIRIRGMVREVITKTPVWVQNGADVVTLILSDHDVLSWPEIETVSANRKFETYD